VGACCVCCVYVMCVCVFSVLCACNVCVCVSLLPQVLLVNGCTCTYLILFTVTLLRIPVTVFWNTWSVTQVQILEPVSEFESVQ